MVETKCACGCGQIVKTPGHYYVPGHVRRGKHKKGKWVECPICGKTRWVFARDLKKGERHFCSQTCHYAFKKGKNLRESNPSWRGGKTLITGRPAVYMPNHYRSGPNGYVYEQIIIAEKILNRPLKYFKQGSVDNEIIHHIDENKKNNELSNLLICTEGYHRFLHGRIQSRRGKDDSRNPS